MRRKKVLMMVKVYKPGLVAPAQEVPFAIARDLIENHGFRVLPSFAQRDSCIICGEEGDLYQVAEIEIDHDTMFADLKPNDQVCTNCLIDLTMPS